MEDTADMVGHHRMARTSNSPRREDNNEYERPRLWPLAAGDHQRGGVHHLRVQLHAPAHRPRLAFLWRILGFRRGTLYRDVRLPPDHLPAFRVAWQCVPWYQPALAQHGAPLGNAYGLER